MAFSGRSVDFLNSLESSEEYQQDFNGYQDVLHEIAAEEAEKVEEEGDINWLLVGGIAAVSILAIGAIILTAGAAAAPIAGAAAATTGATATAAVATGAVATTAAAGATTAAAVGTTAAAAGSSLLTIGNIGIGLQAAAVVTKEYFRYKRNKQAEERVEYERRKEKDVQLLKATETETLLDSLSLSFDKGQDNIKQGILELEVSLDIQANNLENQAKAGRIENNRARIRLNERKKTVEIGFQDNIFKINSEIQAVEFSITQTYKDYTNDKEVLSAYRESAILTAKNDSYQTQGEGEAAWSNVFTAIDATLGGESEQDQANRRLNQSSGAVIQLLQTQNSVQQKAFSIRNNLNKELLGFSTRRTSLESKFSADRFKANSALGIAGKNLETSVKQLATANIAIDGYFSQIDARSKLVESKLSSGIEGLENRYDQALENASVQNEFLIKDLNVKTNLAIDRYNTSKVAGTRLHQDPIGEPINFNAVNNLLVNADNAFNKSDFADKDLLV